MSVKIWIGGASGAANDIGTAANWEPSGVPTTSDTVVFDGARSVVDATSGLSGSNTLEGVALTAIYVYDSYTGKIGTATSPLVCDADTVYLHYKSGSSSTNGSQRINLDLGSGQYTLVCHGSATTSADTGMPPIRVIGSHASNAAYISGSALIGFGVTDDADTYTLASLNMQPDANGAVPTVTLGVGGTLSSATVEVLGGSLLNRGANIGGTMIVSGGTYTANGAATHAGINIQGGGTIVYNSSGTQTGTINVGGSGKLDCSRDARAKTIGAIVARGSATVDLDNGNPNSITVTNGVDVYDDVTLNLWAGGITASLSAV